MKQLFEDLKVWHNGQANKKGQDEFHLALAMTRSLFPNEEAINERVFCDDSPKIARLKQKLKIAKSRQLQSLIFSFPRINDNADDQTKKTKSSKSYSKKHWQFFKEITGESDGKNGFAQVGNDFGNEFTGVFINNDHGVKVT